MIIRAPHPYTHGDADLEGIMVRDDAMSDPRPGILLIHEFTGIGEYMLDHAERLARRGFTVLVGDMYGKGVRPADKSEASRLSRIYRNDRQLMRARAHAGLKALGRLPGVDTTRIHAIGFSFGGCAALELLRSGADLRGAVSFYGYLNTTLPCAPGAVKGRALVLHGAHDKVVPMAEIPVFEDEMRNAGVDYELIVYPDAGHGFANASHEKDPGTGSWFCEETAERAWTAALGFIG